MKAVPGLWIVAGVVVWTITAGLALLFVLARRFLPPC